MQSQPQGVVSWSRSALDHLVDVLNQHTNVIKSHKDFCEVFSEKSRRDASFLRVVHFIGRGRATKDEVDYIVGPPNYGSSSIEARRDKEAWRGVAYRLLHVCAFWSAGMAVPLHRRREFASMSRGAGYEVHYKNLVERHVLYPFACNVNFQPNLGSKKLEDMATYHNFCGLCFVAEDSVVSHLQDRHMEPEIGEEPEIIEGISARDPRKFHTVAFSGESGSGKTIAALFYSGHPQRIFGEPRLVPTTVYATAGSFQLHDLERKLNKLISSPKHVGTTLCRLMQEKTTAWLVDCLRRKWTVDAVSWRSVAILVLDDMGWCPHVTRTLCTFESHPTLAGCLMVEFVAVYVVGCGVDHALAEAGPMPTTFLHIRMAPYCDLDAALRSEVKEAASADEANSGIIGQMLRLSKNARIGKALSTPRHGAIRDSTYDIKCSTAVLCTKLRDICAARVMSALACERSYHALSSHSVAEALSEFGVAFAVACSDIHQTLPRKECVVHGLVTDNATIATGADADSPLVSADNPQHRFHMSEATVASAVSAFGKLRMPRPAWSSYAEMFAAMLSLHVHAAVCAGTRGMPLTEVPQSDPLRETKSWIRKHADKARLMVETTAVEEVATHDGAIELMSRITRGVFASECPNSASTCAVVVRNVTDSSFADVVIGVVTTDDADVLTVTDWLVVRLGFQPNAAGSGPDVFEEWLTMHQMGSRAPEAVIASCVKTLGDDWRKSRKWANVMKGTLTKAVQPTDQQVRAAATARGGGAVTLVDVFTCACELNSAARRRSPLESLDVAADNFDVVGDSSRLATIAHTLSAARSAMAQDDVPKQSKVKSSLLGKFIDLLRWVDDSGQVVPMRYDTMPLNDEDYEGYEQPYEQRDNEAARATIKLRCGRLNDADTAWLFRYAARALVSVELKALPIPLVRVVTYVQMRSGVHHPVATGKHVITPAKEDAAFYPTGWGRERFPLTTSSTT